MVVMAGNLLRICCSLQESTRCFSPTEGRFLQSSAKVRTPLFVETHTLRVKKPSLAGRNVQTTAIQLETTARDPAARQDEQSFNVYVSTPVFEDEAKGIYCYRTASGEVTCEGYDEGPHFHPVARSEQRTVLKNGQRVFLTRASLRYAAYPFPPQVSVYKRVEGRGETWYEGEDES